MSRQMREEDYSAPTRRLAKILYEAYAMNSGWLKHAEWDDLPLVLRGHWCAVASAAIRLAPTMEGSS